MNSLPRRLVVLTLLAVTVAGVGCVRRGEEQKSFLRGVIEQTEAEPRSFKLAERSPGRVLTVEGVVEDDFRYRVAVSLGESPVLEEVVSDDARAIRVSDFASLSQLFPGVQLSPGIQVGTWVLDPLGAASLGAPTTEAARAADPVVEGLMVLRNISAALEVATEAVVLNPEAVGYRADEDPFPHPKEGAGVIRFDLAAPPLPPRRDPRTAAAASSQSGPGQGYPAEEHFRRMALYIKGGRLIEAREVIHPHRLIEELLIRLEDAGVAVDKSAPPETQVATAISALNNLRTRIGGTPVRVRSVVVTLSSEREGVVLPEGATTASLSGVLARGQILSQSR